MLNALKSGLTDVWSATFWFISKKACKLDKLGGRVAYEAQGPPHVIHWDYRISHSYDNIRPKYDK